MAIGARITSNNLSGKTATVNFVPVYGTTSGSTINLGTKTVPFNNINSHPYGVYSLHFAEYDYTYTLTVPEPISTGVQFFVHSNRMVESDNYGVATLNFNDLTANIIDLGININDWNNNNIYEITEGGFMYYFTGTNNTDDKLVIFTDSSNVEISRYSGTTDGFSRNALEGIWVTAEFVDLGVLKYSDGVSVYEYTWDPQTHFVDIEWDWDAVTYDGTFIIKKREFGQWNYNGNGESYLVNPDNGTTTLLKTWADGTFVRHKMHKSSNFIVVETENQSISGNTYTSIEIFDTVGTLLETVPLTGATYNNHYMDFHGTNKYTSAYYNGNDVDVDYKITHYNGNTQSLIQTSHVRGLSYPEVTMVGNDDYWPSRENLNNGGILIGFYNSIAGDTIGTVTTFCDFVYMFDNQSTFSTYVFANDQTKSFTPWGIQISDIIRVACDNGDGVVSFLTIMSGSTRVESMDLFKTDVNGLSYNWMNNKTVAQLYTNNYNDVTYKYINAGGVVTDSIYYQLSTQYSTFFNSYGEITYVGIRSANDGDLGFYIYGNNVDFNPTSYYNGTQTPDTYDSVTKELPDVMFLYSEGGVEGRVLSSTGVTSQFTIPQANSFNTRMGKDKIMFIYSDPNDSNYVKINLYDFSGTLITSTTTSYTGWNSTWGVKDRFVVAFTDGSNITFYMVSENGTVPVTLQNYDGNTEINDYAWND